MKIEYGFVFRPFEEGDSAGNLHLWVEYNGVRRSVGTRYELKDSEWNAEGGRMVLPNAAVRRRKLTRYESGIERDLRQMGSIVQRFGNMNTEYSADDIINAYRKAVSTNRMLGVYAGLQAEELRSRGKERTARGYITTARRFIDFNHGCDLRLDHLTPALIESFQRTLQREGIGMQTVSFYIRTLRAIYNKAVGEELISSHPDDLFENAYIDVE